MADRILVLKGGELVEQGTHEALVALGGLYSELFQLQAAGYRHGLRGYQLGFREWPPTRRTKGSRPT
jgi:hypothetical protein